MKPILFNTEMVRAIEFERISRKEAMSSGS